ncbi:hypothetical protein GDO81_006915 [Engystomops pustulosus]|uniref:Uncharacterized protein n=1 Tax=Engystomops pustulosus TaxID=76066 RepID=A0AAV7D2B7_ENGPU|nr:hypothetical protein GDO81_006915 [Engystomops pustulosus]
MASKTLVHFILNNIGDMSLQKWRCSCSNADSESCNPIPGDMTSPIVVDDPVAVNNNTLMVYITIAVSDMEMRS